MSTPIKLDGGKDKGSGRGEGGGRGKGPKGSDRAGQQLQRAQQQQQQQQQGQQAGSRAESPLSRARRLLKEASDDFGADSPACVAFKERITCLEAEKARSKPLSKLFDEASTELESASKKVESTKRAITDLESKLVAHKERLVLEQAKLVEATSKRDDLQMRVSASAPNREEIGEALDTVTALITKVDAGQHVMAGEDLRRIQACLRHLSPEQLADMGLAHKRGFASIEVSPGADASTPGVGSGAPLAPALADVADMGDGCKDGIFDSGAPPALL